MERMYSRLLARCGLVDDSVRVRLQLPTRGDGPSTRRRHCDPPEVPQDPNAVTAPRDGEVYTYLGPQMRWVQLFLIAAFVLAGASLFVFATAHPMLWPALIVLAFNAASVVFATLTGVNRRRVQWREHQQLAATWTPADGRYPRIDVFLPTCGESLAILRNTYEHVSGLTWRSRVKFFVLDDAARPGVEFLAQEYGFEYIVRPNRGELRKAGNLRHAFDITSGHYVVIFDADFCPRPDFLWHLIPYMDDLDVAVLQSPQTFATTEPMNWIQRTAGATQEFFYRWVLPSRDGDRRRGLCRHVRRVPALGTERRRWVRADRAQRGSPHRPSPAAGGVSGAVRPGGPLARLVSVGSRGVPQPAVPVVHGIAVTASQSAPE